MQPKGPLRLIGRYALYEPIAAGGMGTVHLGRLLGPVGFSRTVAIKRAHPEMAADPEFVSMFLDEARLAARIRHPNVVSTLDVVALDGELFLVMDFVQGESLSRLLRATRSAGEKVPPPIACTILSDVLHGLHAAHEARNERGEPLRIVHRDVSPQNIIVGIDGIARVLDFGVAKAVGRVATTREGQIKGKLCYLSPEQLTGEISRQSDIYSAAVVLWEVLTSERLFQGDNPGEMIQQILNRKVLRPSALVSGLPAAVDDIILKGLARDPADRFATAREMALALERCLGHVSAVEVGDWVEHIAKDAIALRTQKVAEIERHSHDDESSKRAGGDEAAALAAVRRAAEVHATGTVTVTLPSSSSVASITARPPVDSRKSGARLAVGVGAAIVLLLIGTTVARTSRPKSEETAGSSSVASKVIETVPSLEPPPTAALPFAVAPSAPAAAQSELEAASIASSAPAVGRGGGRKPVPRGAGKKTPIDDCSFPYIIDQAGIQHIRRECLK